MSSALCEARFPMTSAGLGRSDTLPGDTAAAVVEELMTSWNCGACVDDWCPPLPRSINRAMCAA